MYRSRRSTTKILEGQQIAILLTYCGRRPNSSKGRGAVIAESDLDRPDLAESSYSITAISRAPSSAPAPPPCRPWPSRPIKTRRPERLGEDGVAASMSNHTGGSMRDALFASIRFDRNELVRECAAAGLVEPLRGTAKRGQTPTVTTGV